MSTPVIPPRLFGHTASLLLSVLLLLTACDRKANPLPDESGGSGGHKSWMSLNLHVGGKGGPVTYAPVHDASEYGIHRLAVLRFRPAGADFVLEEQQDLTPLITSQAGPDYRLEWEVETSQKGVYKFLFVANEPISISPGTTLSSLRSLMLARTMASGVASAFSSTDGIPMTGIATQAGSELIAVTGNTSCEVRLDRAVCRIDVRHRVPALLISGLKMRGVPARSKLFPEYYVLLPGEVPAFTAPALGGAIAGVLPATPLPVPFDNGKDLTKAFYIFENTLPTEAEAARIEVTATLASIPVFYSIPLVDVPNHRSMPLRRAHRYILQLGDGRAVVQAEDWNEVVIEFTFSVPPQVTKATVSGTFRKESGLSNLFILTTDKERHDGQTFELSTIFALHTRFVVGRSSDWVTVQTDDQKMIVSISPNTTGAQRTGWISFYSDAYAPPTYTDGVSWLKIIQEP